MMKHNDAGIEKRISEAVYPADILSDTELFKCELLTRGAWFQCLLLMWRDKTDRVSGTPSQLARLWGCSEDQVNIIVLDLTLNKPCNITEQNGVVTLVSRRLERRLKAAKQAIERKRKQRHEMSTWDVTLGHTVPSSSSSSSSSISTSVTDKKEQAFDLFWEAYPRKVAKRKAHDSFMRHVTTKNYLGLMQALARHKISHQWTKDDGQYIPHPTTWLNQHRWEDKLETLKPPQREVKGPRYIWDGN